MATGGLICLAYRNFSHALLHNLGRETFLAPVHWTEDGWPAIIGIDGHVDTDDGSSSACGSSARIP